MKPVRLRHYAIYAVFVVIALSVLLTVGYLYNSSEFDKIRYSKLCLVRARTQINEFEKNKGRYPDSLSEVRSYAEQHPESGLREIQFTEFFSDSKGNSNESIVLNGLGGWYYNKSTGEIRINITKPVKHYLKFYFGDERNEIPAEW